MMAPLTIESRGDRRTERVHGCYVNLPVAAGRAGLLKAKHCCDLNRQNVTIVCELLWEVASLANYSVKNIETQTDPVKRYQLDPTTKIQHHVFLDVLRFTRSHETLVKKTRAGNREDVES